MQCWIRMPEAESAQRIDKSHLLSAPALWRERTENRPNGARVGQARHADGRRDARSDHRRPTTRHGSSRGTSSRTGAIPGSKNALTGSDLAQHVFDAIYWRALKKRL